MAGPLIVTAVLGDRDQALFDRLRTTYFPPERNQLAAHLTMFHAIPHMLEAELRHRLAGLTAELSPPRAMLSGLMNLGGGVAFRIASDDLDAIRAELSDAFRGHLTQQDSHGWRPHITVQNKVTSSNAIATLADLERGFSQRPLVISGLAYHHYEGGPWRLGRRYPFRRTR
ncbi:MAG: 2'-5' RNA ligase family protein [Pseudomonadota bacterium]|nr:2'-5' RNA ligase family protein [Pseudomonadota bacterium]